MDKYAFLDISKEDMQLVNFIVERYFYQKDSDGIIKMSLEMDLMLAHYVFKLRLESLSVADQIDFNHDLAGIQNNINREELCFDNHFVPRFATQ